MTTTVIQTSKPTLFTGLVMASGIALAPAAGRPQGAVANADIFALAGRAARRAANG
jgi:hypothetical protein